MESKKRRETGKLFLFSCLEVLPSIHDLFFELKAFLPAQRRISLVFAGFRFQGIRTTISRLSACFRGACTRKSGHPPECTVTVCIS
jgi:hypothetical protein